MTNKIKLIVVLAILVLVGFSINLIRSNAKKDVREKAWAVLQEYLASAKAHDIEGVTRLSYQISESCRNRDESKAIEDDCNMRMDAVYNLGSTLKKENFGNVWFDSKQIILTTDWKEARDADILVRARSIIYFTMDNEGKIKVLFFKAAQGNFVNEKDENKLIGMTEDRDQDGIEDYVETCSGSNDTVTCVKTDPRKRDTDKDGSWDGVEALFYKENK